MSTDGWLDIVVLIYIQFMEMPVLIKRHCTLDQETKQTSTGRNLNQDQEKLLFSDYK
jgi:hypothetical protein